MLPCRSSPACDCVPIGRRPTSVPTLHWPGWHVIERSAVRGAALEVLRDMLASRNTPNDPQQLDGVADALRQILESDEANTRVRLAVLEALGHLLALKADVDWSRELLIAQLNGAADTRRAGRGGYGTVSYREPATQSPRY